MKIIIEIIPVLLLTVEKLNHKIWHPLLTLVKFRLSIFTVYRFTGKTNGGKFTGGKWYPVKEPVKLPFDALFGIPQYAIL